MSEELVEQTKYKYSDLLNENLLMKLLQCSFKNPTLNIRIWKYYTRHKEDYNFLRAEYEKSKGNEKYLTELLDYEVQVIKKFELTFDDFDNDNCKFSENQYAWLNGKEMDLIINWCKN